ncbi:MAG: branched-chain amino acid ABC transporter permease [Gammaproteobacteria bacterium]|nr:branched-chain amino acid ABC transporter permease [Gammaproteobacteria bacterium]
MTQIPRPVSLLLLVLLLLLAFYPLYGEAVVGERAAFILQKLTTIIILAIFAMSLDLLVGVTGMVSLGHALFFGAAGYVLALLAPEYEAANIWLVLPASLAFSGVLALLVGLLSIRTSGVYFIMVTLAFGQMGFYLVNDAAFAGGSDGMYLMMKPEVSLGGINLLDLENRQTFFYLCLACMVAVYLLLRMLVRSPFGRVLTGIHLNEHRTLALGYNVNHYKVVCFVIAGMLAGLAGFLSATQYGFVNPSIMGWHASGHALVMVILGGAGTLFGAILGAFTFEILHYIFEGLTEHWLLLMGAVSVAVVLFMPQGIAGWLLSLGKSRNRVSEQDKAESKKPAGQARVRETQA